MRNTWLFALLLWMFVLPPAQPQEKTTNIDNSGNQFLLQCGDMMGKSSSDAFQRGECFGYVEGLDAGAKSIVALEGLKQPPYCMPEEVTIGQIANILLKFIKDHPEKTDIPASVLAVDSLMLAFPCKAEVKK